MSTVTIQCLTEVFKNRHCIQEVLRLSLRINRFMGKYRKYSLEQKPRDVLTIEVMDWTYFWTLLSVQQPVAKELQRVQVHHMIYDP